MTCHIHQSWKQWALLTYITRISGASLKRYLFIDHYGRDPRQLLWESKGDRAWRGWAR